MTRPRSRQSVTSLALLLAAGLAGGCASAAPAEHRAPAAPRSGAPAAARGGTAADPGHAGRRAPVNIYAHIAAGEANPAWARDPYRVYVPDSLSNSVTEINPHTYKVIRTFAVGGQPNHVTPSWDGSVLWANDTAGSSLTPISPRTGRPGRPVAVADPYNLYFTPDGRSAMVMAEAQDRIDFRNPRTMKLQKSVHVPCAGVNHLDFTADGRHAVASCEFSGQLLWINVQARKVARVLRLGPGSGGPVPMAMTATRHRPAMPQDVRLSADGRTFYVADMMADGVWLVSARHFTVTGFRHTGAGTHGFLVSRNGKYLYISNRGEGSISVLDFATRKIIHKWWIHGGGSPDMGGISPDGRVMWWSGRYDAVVYAMSTRSGRLLAKIAVPAGPHGLCVFPQPGRYSLGHTGNFR